jgi:hypothetical protein
MENFKFGDIIEGTKTRHPIVFFSVKNKDQFYGCIITHSERYSNNFTFKKEHFLEKDENGRDYKVQYENSFYVKLKLEKQNDWGPFLKIGALSNEGIKIIKSNVQIEQPVEWRKYMKIYKK